MSFKNLTFEAIGTHWQIDIFEDSPLFDEVNFFDSLKSRIEKFEQTYSRFREDSWLRGICSKPGEYELPSDAEVLFDLYFEFYKLTDGIFTPLIGQTLMDAGYDEKYSLQAKEKISKPKKLEEVFEYNFPILIVKEKAILDFGACGKGYIIDIVSELLVEANIKHFCVDAGGDIFYKNNGTEKMRVGLENPNNFSEVIGVAEIHNQSICSSSGSRRKWGDFNHIINPKTLESPKDVIATWVIADTAILADALATSLHLVDKKAFLEKYKFEYVIMYADNSVEKSDNFLGELFLS
ncbi:MAG: FAD:protein FMN transferase [Patescibacteria group bacterium]|nr:FAD:protein FMN transferase [Patescibacteria group bacterium]